MKAAVLHAIGEPLRIEEVPTPHPRPGQVLVKVAAAGVCHSDLHLIDATMKLGLTSLARQGPARPAGGPTAWLRR